ncbi:MAG: hypothetical protein MI924_12185 [Chloroflexales bacterium]|nr:hypothetical protein [Chloroflexales bacterium]
MTTAYIDQLLAGVVQTVTFYPDGRQVVDAPPRGAILSGSFNPLHAGHVALATAAATQTGLPAFFELPVVNADKGTLDASDVARRLAQFQGKYTLILSRAPLFSQKAKLFLGSVFVIGYDTAVRLLAPRYYGGAAGMQQALAAIRAAGCSFLVAGRVSDGQFHTLANVAVAPDFRDLFIDLPETAFRVDISSTELRARGGMEG